MEQLRDNLHSNILLAGLMYPTIPRINYEVRLDELQISEADSLRLVLNTLGMDETSDVDVDRVARLNVINQQRMLIGSGCKLHFSKQPMKLSKAVKQYVYDDAGIEYLDCVGNISHVGHCHPHVTYAGQKQMTTLAIAQGFVTDVQANYAQSILKTLPDTHFDTVLLVNSGSEANDLAIRLAKLYTKRKDIITMMPAIYGSLSNLVNLNYVLKRQNKECDNCKENIHCLDLCNTYRGRFADKSDALELAVQELNDLLIELREKKKPVAAYITESMHTAAGCVCPPKQYFPSAVKSVKKAGGLIIIDEMLTGLGRLGEHMWGFQHHDIIPDIVTCGRAMGNGQPLAMVITSNRIASGLVEYSNSYGGNPVSCAMGQAVLDVLSNEKLLSSCAAVGKELMKGLVSLKSRHENIGDVRGMGLCLAMEMVQNKESKKPSREIAEKLSFRLRDEYKILVPHDGPDHNCIFIIPPMCFSMENAHTLVRDIDKAMTDLEQGKANNIKTIFELTEMVPEDVLTSMLMKRKGQGQDVLPSKVRRVDKYEDMD